MKKLMTSIVVIWAALSQFCPLRATPNWDIYSDAVIQEGDEYNFVRVYDTPPEHTTLNITGGILDWLEAHDESIIDMTGGSVSSLGIGDYTTANISGGYVYGTGAGNYGTINFSGTARAVVLTARDFGTVNITGGTAGHAGALQSATLNIFAGEILDGIGADYSGTLHMTGGTTQGANLRGAAIANLSGGFISDFLMATEDSTVNIFGHNLVKMEFGGKYGHGQVSGFWPDNSAFTMDLKGLETYSHLNLIPEPSSVILLALGLLLLKTKNTI